MKTDLHFFIHKALKNICEIQAKNLKAKIKIILLLKNMKTCSFLLTFKHHIHNFQYNKICLDIDFRLVMF